ncbi:MAG: hypothetical protein ACREPY_08710 [Rhodanobacteraceae bacterium]
MSDQSFFAATETFIREGRQVREEKLNQLFFAFICALCGQIAFAARVGWAERSEAQRDARTTLGFRR